MLGPSLRAKSAATEGKKTTSSSILLGLQQYPMSPQRVLLATLKAALFDNLTMGPIELAKSRLKAVVTIKKMAKDLEEHEISLKHECSPLVREVLNTKRIALWEALLRASNFTDMDIVEVVNLP